ncbi:MAG: CDP-alcohol phosphatidyltransferase family protein [Candidatus Saccharimonadales bacterium]
MHVISKIRSAVRAVMRRVASLFNILSGGRLSPDTVTIVGFAAHIPVAILIATRHNIWAAALLIVFGLFDTLDGELARLQKKASPRGMLLDASTDRMKEVLLYSGAAYALAVSAHPTYAVWAAAAVGASICVSYVKAKGEAAVASLGKKIPHDTLNHMFAGGFLTFEIRMVVLAAGLVFNQLLWAVVFVAVFASLTAIWRLVRISRQL